MTPFYIFPIFSSENAILPQFESSKKTLNFTNEGRDFLEGSGIYEAIYQAFVSGKQVETGSLAHHSLVLVPRSVIEPLSLSVPGCKTGDFWHCHLELVGVIKWDKAREPRLEHVSRTLAVLTHDCRG